MFVPPWAKINVDWLCQTCIFGIFLQRKEHETPFEES